MGSATAAELRALLSLIHDSAQQAIETYENYGNGVPSLDSLDSHPIESQSGKLVLHKAIRILEGACEQLCSTLAPPGHTVFNRIMSGIEVASIRVATEHRVADVLLEHPDGLHVREISKLVGIESGKLTQILRLLATRHCFREVAVDVFSNNHLSLSLLSSSPSSDLVGLFAEQFQKCFAFVPEALADPDYGPSYDPVKSSFMFAYKASGIEGNMFDWMKAHPEHSQRFGRAMTGWAMVTDAITTIGNFPWGALPSGTTICDVGSGVGTTSIELAKAYPSLKLILHDLPNVTEQGKELWSKDLPQAIEENRVEFIAMDFFKDIPAKGNDIYYIRHCVHNWPDADALVLLRNVREAMRSDSRLLIHDYILQQSCRTEQSVSQASQIGVDIAPEPLLPNFGTGNLRAHSLDVTMMAILNAKERSLTELEALGSQAGLTLVKVWNIGEKGIAELC